MSANIVADNAAPAAQIAAPVLTVVRGKAGGFTKAKDSLGCDVKGLWRRNGRFYCQFSIPGKGCRRLALLDENNQPVGTVMQAVDAMHELRKKKRLGELPARDAPRSSTSMSCITSRSLKRQVERSQGLSFKNEAFSKAGPNTLAALG